MKKKPTAKPVRPAKRNTKKKTQVTAKDVPESKPSPAPTKGTNPTLVFKSESWKEKEDEIERLIAENPRNALRIAENAIDYSIELFVRLIKRKSLCVPDVPDPCEDGTKSSPPYDWAAHSLYRRLARITHEVKEHAKTGHWQMILAAWCNAINFTETVHDIALAHPDRLELLARGSLFMPSLRARPGNFDYDFPKIAEKTHLSEDFLPNTSAGAKYQLDTPATRLVADCVRNVEWYRPVLKHLKSSFADYQQGAASGIAEYQKYAGLQFEQWLVDHLHWPSYELHYDDLPPLTKKTVKFWWDNAIKGEVERRFSWIAGTAFHTELQKATASGKDYQVKDELKRRCHQALKSLARPDPKD